MVGPFSGRPPSVVQATCGWSVQCHSVVGHQVWYRPLVVGPFSGRPPSVVQATCGWSVQW